MGSADQLRFIERYASEFNGPFLEAGSRDYGNTQDLRALFAANDTADYVGVDMIEGPGVDVAVDLAGDFGVIDRTLGGRRFGTVFCLSVLEHCENPFAMAKNLAGLLKPGGKVCVSVPFAFRLHAYPDDLRQRCWARWADAAPWLGWPAIAMFWRRAILSWSALCGYEPDLFRACFCFNRPLPIITILPLPCGVLQGDRAAWSDNSGAERPNTHAWPPWLCSK